MKKYEYNNYNIAYEMALNFFRLLIATLIFVIPVDIRTAILISLAIMGISIFINYKKPRIKDIYHFLDINQAVLFEYFLQILRLKAIFYTSTWAEVLWNIEGIGR